MLKFEQLLIKSKELINKKRFSEARKLLEEANRLKKDPEIYYYLGVVYTALKEWEEAIIALRRIEEGFETFVDIRNTYILLAYNFTQLKDYMSALEYLKKAFSLHSKDITVLGALGYVYHKLGDNKTAIEILNKALEIAPEDPHLMNSLAFILADSNTDLKKAEELAKKTLEFNPNQPAYLDTMGWVYYKKGNTQLARKYLKAAYDKLPNNEEIKSHIAKLLDI